MAERFWNYFSSTSRFRPYFEVEITQLPWKHHKRRTSPFAVLYESQLSKWREDFETFFLVLFHSDHIRSENNGTSIETSQKTSFCRLPYLTCPDCQNDGRIFKTFYEYFFIQNIFRDGNKANSVETSQKTSYCRLPYCTSPDCRNGGRILKQFIDFTRSF